MKRTLVAALFILGCGTNTESGPGPSDLIGTWFAQISATDAMGAKFDGSKFALDQLATLADGSLILDIIQGTYTATESAAVLRITGASCQGVENLRSNAKSIAYSRSGTALSLNLGTRIVILQPSPQSTGTGTAQIGCIKSDNTFTPNPVTPVP